MPMDETIPTLPQGFVVGRILQASTDGPDAGAGTDVAVTVGFVDFTPASAYRKLSATTVVTHAKATAKLDSHGHLHPSRATADNTGSNTEDGLWLDADTYTVTYRLNGGTLPSHQIEVTTAHTELAPLALFATMGDAPLPGATYVTLTLPTGGTPGQYLVLNPGASGLTWATGVPPEAVATAVEDYLTANPVAGGYPVQQVTLTAPLAYTLPVGAPVDHVVSIVFTQDGTGGHTVTYDSKPVTVDLAPSAVTTVQLHPVGAGYVVHYPASSPAQPRATIDAAIAAAVADRATASSLSVSRAAIHSIEGLGVSRPVDNGMKLVTNFTSGKWVDNGGAVLVQGHTGYDANGNVTGITSRTGQPSMLKWTPPADTVGEINLSLPATNLRTPNLGGKFMLAVYIEAQPGYQPGNVNANLKGTLGVTLTTTTNANGLYLAYNVNQLREGWNFLKFVMRDPTAYVPASGVAEVHPFGVTGTTLGTGAGTNIKDAPIAGMKIAVQNMGGATLYFDSVWTGWNSMPQVVLGCDQATADTVSLALPKYVEYGWLGYFAMPLRLWAGGDTILTDIDSTPHWAHAEALYAAGWDCVNHTVNHFPGTTGGPERMATLTDPAQIMYEMRTAEAAYRARGMTRGVRYYASPLSSSSRLSEKVIREGGWLMQRHSRKMNVSVTPWGVDNLHHLGSSDLGSAAANGTGITITTGGVAVAQGGMQRFSRIKQALDVIVAYGDTWMPFWHQITQVGDSGSGEDLTGDNVTITWSALRKAFEYIHELEVAGTLHVCDGMTGFYYGVGH